MGPVLRDHSMYEKTGARGIYVVGDPCGSRRAVLADTGLLFDYFRLIPVECRKNALLFLWASYTRTAIHQRVMVSDHERESI